MIYIKLSSIKEFVEYGSKRLLPIDVLVQMIFTFVFFSFISTVYGVICKGVVLYISIVIDCLTLFYIIGVALLKKKKNTIKPRDKFKIAGIFSMFSSAYFILFANLIFSLSINSSLQHRLILIFGLIFILLIYFVVTIYWINKEKFKNKKKVKKDNVVLFSLLGSITGVSIARILFANLNQEAIINIAVLCFFIISMFFSFGAVNLFKYYLIKKYNISLDYMKDKQCVVRNKEFNHKKKNTLATKIFVTFVLAVLTLFIMLFIIGITH